MSLALLNVFLYRKYLERGIVAANNAENVNRFNRHEKICRICGENGDIDIFNYNAGKTIADDINRCSDITVSPNDGFPSFMCAGCHTLLQNAVKFRKMCLESISKLRKSRLKSEVIIALEPKEELLSESGASDIDDAEPSLPLAKFPLPPATGPSHIADSDELFADIIPNCITCHRDFLSVVDYRKHLPNCSKTLLKSKGIHGHANKLKFGKARKGVFLCEVCGKTLTQLGSYLAHKSTHSNVFPYKCEQCAYRGKTKDLLRTHLRSHLRVKPYVCEVCSVTCSTSSNLAKHRRTHETHEPQRCPQCDKMYSRKERLARHITEIHGSSQPVDCDVCGKRFLRRKGLVKHRLKQHKLRTARGGRLPAYLLARASSPPVPTTVALAHREAVTPTDTTAPNSTMWVSQAGSKTESAIYGTDKCVNSSAAAQ